MSAGAPLSRRKPDVREDADARLVRDFDRLRRGLAAEQHREINALCGPQGLLQRERRRLRHQ